MNYLKAIVVALFAVSEVYGASLECPLICPALYRPVCGTNGKEFVQFSNLCDLNTKNCNLQRLELSTFKETHIELCTTIDLDEVQIDVLKDLDNQCPQMPIPMVYRPVCGTDGIYRKTFANEWLMKALNCSNKNNWRVLKEESCSKTF